MRKLFAVVLLAFSFCANDCFAQVFEKADLRLERGLSDGVMLLKGFKSCALIRWEGGIPVGWIRITEEGKSRRIELKIASTVKALVGTDLVDTDPKACSGWIIIGIRQPSKGAIGEEVSVALVVEQRFRRGTRLRTAQCTNMWEGTIPPAKSGEALPGAISIDAENRIQGRSTYETTAGNNFDFFEFSLQSKEPVKNGG